jgi:hypothetical protein
MLGDGTEEQNLNQPGATQDRITEEEFADAFKEGRAAQAGKTLISGKPFSSARDHRTGHEC